MNICQIGSSEYFYYTLWWLNMAIIWSRKNLLYAFHCIHFVESATWISFSLPVRFGVKIKLNCDFVLVWEDVEIVHLLHVAGGSRKPAVTRFAKFCLYITHFIWLGKCRDIFALAFAWKSFDKTGVWHFLLHWSIFCYCVFILVWRPKSCMAGELLQWRAFLLVWRTKTGRLFGWIFCIYQ